MNKKKVGIVSLGCAKNLVDSEMILASFIKNGYESTNNPNLANVIIINTCGFIEKSQQESLNTIIEMMKYQPHAKIIVTGCLAELYAKELKQDYPNIEVVVPFSKYQHFNEYVKSVTKDKKDYSLNPLNRKILTNNYFAYLRIAEGCNNFCSFCAIPYIRGRYKSRLINDLVKEASALAKSGITELTVIAQDTSMYGLDLKDGSNIEKLLARLEKVKGIKHIRLLYLYPSEITDNFINFMKHSKKVYPYFDIPLQHIDDDLLKRMNRKWSSKKTLEVLNKIKKEVPNAIFRTTFIVGFPGETDKAFNKLIKFVKEFKFDLLGAFTYSREEGTRAYLLDHQVKESIKNKRYKILMETQSEVIREKNKRRVGEIIEGLYFANDKDNHPLFLTKYNSPDGSDGNVIANKQYHLKLGNYYKLKVVKALTYDLIVEILK